MKRNISALAVAAALLFLAPATNAGTTIDPQAVLQVETARLWGDLHGEAAMSALLHQAQVGDHRPSPVTFELEAEAIDAQTDVREGMPHAAGVQGGGTKSTRPAHHGESRVELMGPPRAHYELAMLPLLGQPAPTLSVEQLKCLDLQTSATQAVAPRALVDGGRTMPRQDVSRSLALHSTCQDAYTLQGSFWLSLYEYDFRVREQNGVTEYITGESSRDAVQDPTNQTTGVGVHTTRQTFLTVHNATLTLRLPPDAVLTFHVTDLRVAGATTVQALGAVGDIASHGQWIHVDGEDLDVSGDMELAAPGVREHRVQFLIIDGARALRSNHDTILLAAFLPAAPAPNTTLLLASLVAAGGLVLVLLLRRRRAGSTRSARIREASKLFRTALEHRRRRHYLRALYFIARYQKHVPHDGDGVRLRALVYGNLRLWRLAVRNHHRAHNLLMDAKKWEDVAWNAYAAACAYSRLRQAPEANWWLEKAVELDPSFMHRASMEADFGPLWHHADFREAIQQLSLACGTRAATG